MVQVYETQHRYEYDFHTATMAYFNKYPNPFSDHVISVDTVSHKFLSPHEFVVERLIHKRGTLPKLVERILGKITDAWILETSLVNRSTRTLKSWTRNLDHRDILRVDDTAVYTEAGNHTTVAHSVRFLSRMSFVRSKIEEWSKRSFAERVHRSRQGMAHVMGMLRTAAGVRHSSVL